MRNIKLFEDWKVTDDYVFEDWKVTDDSVNWADNIPKEVVRELTKPTKEALSKINSMGWEQIAANIERIDCLIKGGFSGGLQWKDLLKDSSLIGGSRNQEMGLVSSGNSTQRDIVAKTAIDYFAGLLFTVLDYGICKDARSGYWRR